MEMYVSIKPKLGEVVNILTNVDFQLQCVPVGMSRRDEILDVELQMLAPFVYHLYLISWDIMRDHEKSIYLG